MATKRTLVNKKTGAEHKVENADNVLKKYKGVFVEKPSAAISPEVAKKEQQLNAKDIDVKDAKTVSDKTVSDKNVNSNKK